MIAFIDTHDWPLARLVMPDEVADADAADHLAQLDGLYARRERFVLLLGGAELPRHSPAFMQAYAQWSQASLDLARRYCLGAIRIEPDAALRQTYAARAEQAAKAGSLPYPYRVVANEQSASDLAAQWLAQPTEDRSAH